MSAWSSLLVTIAKKDGKLRLCGDYRRVYAVTKDDPYCMPRQDEILDKIGSAKFITKLDMLKGYYQVSSANDCQRQGENSVRDTAG